MRKVIFHSDYHPVTVCINGTPITVHGEVEVILSKPQKVGDMDKKVWEALNQKSAESINAVGIPAGRDKDA